MTKVYLAPLVSLILLSATPVSANLNCALCNTPMSPNSARPGQDDACEDLYAAACLTPQGTLRYEGSTDARDGLLRSKVRTALDAGAKEIGYPSVVDALRAKLKERGITLPENPDPKALDALLQEPGTYFQSSTSNKLFGSDNQCNEEISSLGASFSKGAASPTPPPIAEIKALTEKYAGVTDKYREQIYSNSVADVTAFAENILDSCENFRGRPEMFPPETNPDAVRVCAQSTQIRRRAVDLYRREGTEGFKAEADKFVREFALGSLNYKAYPSYTATGNGTSPQSPEVLAAMSDNLAAITEATGVCTPYTESVALAAEDVAKDLLETLSHSKATVETMISTTYTSERKAKAQALHNSVKSDMEDVVSRMVTDPKKRGDIIDSFGNIDMFWMDKPPSNLYSTSNGILVLDQSKTQLGDGTYDAFEDPSLTFFSALNATYMPEISVGKVSADSTITMQPAMLQYLDNNPSTYIGVLAHEFGHNIDYRNSAMNGFDLRPDYREILACYKDPASIKIVEGQEGEVLGDYLSSEVLARQINRLPADQRRRAVLSSVEFFCSADEDRHNEAAMKCEGTHPDPQLRISGIFGASPNLRAAMGCEKDSSKYKTCGIASLKGTANATVNSPTSTRTQTEQPSAVGGK